MSALSRLDVLLVARGFFPSRERAKSAIQSGAVYIDGKQSAKPGATYPDDAEIELRGETLGFVSRGGLKLEYALDNFKVSPAGLVCADIGASTGGFTDCLLRRGAKLVYAIDVGHGQLARELREDRRVVNIEGVNARDLQPRLFGESPELRPELAVIDVSFISLALVLPSVKLALPEAEIICLIKPQFEAGRGKVGKNGIVRDVKTHIEVLDSFVSNARASRYAIAGLTYSPVSGAEGNLEFLAHLSVAGGDIAIDTALIAKSAHEKFTRRNMI
jgi:23S rRNA (cytidine1920-2'-O)/16S rRNA (cytidine1409-2'-O)-methyltransferase